jgi:hypothetical protein
VFRHLKHVACSECGAAVGRSEKREHVCDRERLIDHQMFQLRDELAGLEDEIDAYLDSPRGRLEAWWATERRCRAG